MAIAWGVAVAFSSTNSCTNIVPSSTPLAKDRSELLLSGQRLANCRDESSTLNQPYRLLPPVFPRGHAAVRLAVRQETNFPVAPVTAPGSYPRRGARDA